MASGKARKPGLTYESASLNNSFAGLRPFEALAKKDESALSPPRFCISQGNLVLLFYYDTENNFA